MSQSRCFIHLRGNMENSLQQHLPATALWLQSPWAPATMGPGTSPVGRSCEQRVGATVAVTIMQTGGCCPVLCLPALPEPWPQVPCPEAGKDLSSPTPTVPQGLVSIAGCFPRTSGQRSTGVFTLVEEAGRMGQKMTLTQKGASS